jgi:iron complex outermembrane receptor protein
MGRIKMYRTLLGASAALLFIGIAQAASAQETPSPAQQHPENAAAPEGVFGDIVVTAQKREQKLQDVGISITALSGQALDTLGLHNMQQVGQQVPGLQLQTFTPAFTVFNLRGISQNNFQDNLEAPVAVYVNDVYIGSMNAVGQQMFDMDRVEVLRGPQGTLFGRNATGGLIHYITRTADRDEWNGYAEGSVAEFNSYSVEGAAGGAVGSGLRVRLAGRWEKSDGYVKAGFNPVLDREATGRTSHGANGFALRGAAQADLGDATVVDLIASYSRDHDVPTGEYTVRFAEADPVTGLGINPGPPITGDVHRHASDENPFFNRTVLSLTGKVKTQITDGIELTYIGSYLRMKKFYEEDAGGGLFFFPFQTFNTYKQWSQEVRLSGDSDRFRWQVGAYYLNMNFDGGFNVAGEALTGDPDGLFAATTLLKSKNWSIFGQAEYDLAPKLTAIVGLRWSQDNKHIKFRELGYNLTGVPDGTVLFDFAEAIAANPQFAGHDRINYGDVAARAQLNYKPNEDWLLFASFNRGIKGGNWSPSPSVDLANFRHKNEVLYSYELGFKSTLTPGVRLNGTAFYYDYKDYQAFSLTGLQPQVANSDATVKGGEIELFANPVRHLDLSLGASFLDSRVDFVPAVFPGTGTVNAHMPQAPDFSLNWLARYGFDLPPGELAVQIDGRYNSSQFMEGTNSQVSFQKKYAVVNASISLTSADKHWQATAWVKNFTNKDYLLYNLDLGLIGFVEQVYAPPRQFGGTIRVSF